MSDCDFDHPHPEHPCGTRISPKRRGWTLRWRGRGLVRATVPSRRVRVGWDRNSVSFGLVIIRWLGR